MGNVENAALVKSLPKTSLEMAQESFHSDIDNLIEKKATKLELNGVQLNETLKMELPAKPSSLTVMG